MDELNRKRWLIATLAITLAVLIIGFGIYVFVFYSQECDSVECFKENLEKCTKASYLNEGLEATWKYEVKGTERNLCEVNVKILQAKSGTLNLDKLNGMEMNCYLIKGTFSYPEKDISKCHGILKEEIQTIIIDNLHNYIIDNVGKISDELDVKL